MRLAGEVALTTLALFALHVGLFVVTQRLL
jgi:hypothetical protein